MVLAGRRLARAALTRVRPLLHYDVGGGHAAGVPLLGAAAEPAAALQRRPWSGRHHRAAELDGDGGGEKAWR